MASTIWLPPEGAEPVSVLGSGPWNGPAINLTPPLAVIRTICPPSGTSMTAPETRVAPGLTVSTDELITT